MSKDTINESKSQPDLLRLLAGLLLPMSKDTINESKSQPDGRTVVIEGAVAYEQRYNK